LRKKNEEVDSYATLEVTDIKQLVFL
jgi:hypothetical protein